MQEWIAEGRDASRTGHSTCACQYANVRACFSAASKCLICPLMICCSSFPARACFCTNFARRRAASLPSPKANAVSASWKRSSVAMAVALGSFNTDSGCCRQYSSHFAHIAANSPRMTLTFTAQPTAGTVWWRPENTRVSEAAPMAVLKNTSYGGLQSRFQQEPHALHGIVNPTQQAQLPLRQLQRLQSLQRHYPMPRTVSVATQRGHWKP